MNQRLQQFLAAENINQSQFADTIGVARASISHILAGRNKPGFDFIESMALHYPALNLEWLITGRGRMYANPAKSATGEPAGPISSQAPAAGASSGTPSQRQEPTGSDTFISNLGNNPQTLSNQKTITKVIVFYSDGSFQELR